MLLLSKFSSIIQFRGAAVGAKPVQRTLEIAMDQEIQPFRHPDGVLLHTLADPFQRHAHQRLLVEIHDELYVVILHGDPLHPAFHELPQHGVQQLI